MRLGGEGQGAYAGPAPSGVDEALKAALKAASEHSTHRSALRST